MKYYDHQHGIERYKRRYVWGLWAYVSGLVSGLILLSALAWIKV